MNREEYNACISKSISGKKFSKEERKKEFCISAKTCSGKVNNREEAVSICSKPKMPKWAKTSQPAETKPIPCDERMSRVRRNIDVIGLKVKTGEADAVKSTAAQMLQDIMDCKPDDVIVAIAEEAASGVKDLSGRFYLAGEAKDLITRLNVLKEILS